MNVRQKLRWGLATALIAASGAVGALPEVISVDLPSDSEVEIRQFHTPEAGDRLLLGFACDTGDGEVEMQTAEDMAGKKLEIWMPDLLTAHFLPKLKSSIDEIPTEDVVALIDYTLDHTQKKVYLVSSGGGSAMLLRGLAAWEAQNPDRLEMIRGVLLLYPRLVEGEPAPGKELVYVDAVGKTRTPISILEGEKTPNRWALPDLERRLAAGGSTVVTDLIPGVRGFFYEREKGSLSEQVVTEQLSGLVRAALVKLDVISRKKGS